MSASPYQFLHEILTCVDCGAKVRRRNARQLRCLECARDIREHREAQHIEGRHRGRPPTPPEDDAKIEALIQRHLDWLAAQRRAGRPVYTLEPWEQRGNVHENVKWAVDADLSAKPHRPKGEGQWHHGETHVRRKSA